jgi:hypothetical protein
MERTAPKTLGLERVLVGRLWRVGTLAALLSAGATGSSAGTLALMRVVAAVTNVGLLTKLGRKEQGVLRRPGIWREVW